MKKCVCFLLLLLMLLLSGCSGVEQFRNDLYVVTKKGDTCYLKVHSDVYASMFEDETWKRVDSPTYASVAEMKQGIQDGNITVPQLEDIYRDMYRINRLRNGSIPIVDINNLHDACLPSSISDKKVFWFGLAYRFEFQEGAVSGGISSLGTKDYKERKEWYSASGCFENYGYTSQDYLIVSESFDPERNATTIVWKRRFGPEVYSEENKMVFYTYSDDSKTISYAEYYPNARDPLPEIIRFVWNQGGYFFEGSAKGFSEMPSYEWLTSFGMVPYAETEAEQGSTQ